MFKFHRDFKPKKWNNVTVSSSLSFSISVTIKVKCLKENVWKNVSEIPLFKIRKKKMKEGANKGEWGRNRKREWGVNSIW